LLIKMKLKEEDVGSVDRSPVIDEEGLGMSKANVLHGSLLG